MPPAEFRILAINPGLHLDQDRGLRQRDRELARDLDHCDAQMEPFRGRPILDQLAFRRAAIEAALTEAAMSRSMASTPSPGAAACMRPIASGTYRVNEAMLADLRAADRGEHASNLGAFLADELAASSRCQAFVVDPVSVDEFSRAKRACPAPRSPARAPLSCPEHQGRGQALCARARLAAMPTLRLVVAHLGSGISVSAHEGGRMVDVNLAGQEGPMSTERAGGAAMAFAWSSSASAADTRRTASYNALFREGGLYSYLGTRDLREVENRIRRRRHPGRAGLRRHGLPDRERDRRHGRRPQRPRRRHPPHRRHGPLRQTS